MKTMGLIGMMALMLCGCDDQEQKHKDQAFIHDTAEIAGLRESIRFNNESLSIAFKHVEACRNQVRNASAPNELAIAEDDLREARKELDRIQSDIEKAEERIRQLSDK